MLLVKDRSHGKMKSGAGVIFVIAPAIVVLIRRNLRFLLVLQVLRTCRIRKK
jgi:hypothetical protein